MRVLESTRVPKQPRTRVRFGRRVALAALAATLAVSFGLHAPARAQDTAAPNRTHSLGVNLEFPDDGLVDSEQLCVALFSGTSPDLQKPPLLSRCIDPGASAVTFEGLRPGDFSVLLPGPGSDVEGQRYEGQLVTTSIPDDEQLDAFGIDINVGLSPEFTGTTGSVQVSVFGCPAGTNAGADKDSWVNECKSLAGGVPMTLTGIGSINDAAFQKVTGVSGNASGRVEFTDLPAGAYEIGGVLPSNVSDNPALFAESSIDGSLGAIGPADSLALRPTETVAVDVFLVLDDTPDSTAMIGTTDMEITGALPG
ncbi:MAG: hypothetical protein KC442_20370 [Thermomicrobiales bacterium]|nr:hypothetical protein [Thermomicrobiales bacterium]